MRRSDHQEASAETHGEGGMALLVSGFGVLDPYLIQY